MRPDGPSDQRDEREEVSLSRSPQLLFCRPVLTESNHFQSTGLRDVNDGHPLPLFHCCVRIERQLMPGARRADASVQPVRLTVLAPLTLRNTLPVDLHWSLTASADLDGQLNPNLRGNAMSPPLSSEHSSSTSLRMRKRVTVSLRVSRASPTTAERRLTSTAPVGARSLEPAAGENKVINERQEALGRRASTQHQRKQKYRRSMKMTRALLRQKPKRYREGSTGLHEVRAEALQTMITVAVHAVSSMQEWTL